MSWFILVSLDVWSGVRVKFCLRVVRVVYEKERFVLECQLHRSATGNRLTDTFLQSFHEVADLYDGQNPRDLQTYQQRSKQLTEQFSAAHRQELASALVEHLRQLGAPEASVDNARRLADVRTVAVVTGQQAGLFTGPIYALAKALTAIGVAEQLSQDLQQPVVPVFWVASEDHDWDEVNHAYILTEEGRTKRVSLAMRPDLHSMVYHTPLEVSAVESALDSLQQLLPKAEYKWRMIEEIRSFWHPGDSLSHWFARIMAHLLGERGLVLLDPCLPRLRALVANAFSKALEASEEIRHELNRCYDEIRSRGFTPEVMEDKSNSNVFWVEDGKRYVLERVDRDLFRSRGLNREFSLNDLRVLVTHNPNAFSSNVLLRPLIQDELLPTLVYLGGPSEIAYYPLARGVFHAFGKKLPPLLLRQRMQMVPQSVASLLEAWGITWQERNEIDQLERNYLLSNGLLLAREQIAKMQAEWSQQLLRLEEQLPLLGPQLPTLLQRSAVRQEAELHRLELKISRLIELQGEIEIRHRRLARNWLYPDGQLQERRLSLMNLWSMYGKELLKQLPAWGQYEDESPLYHIEI
ncbi:bacillithiol biosynthesis cysteine-adding enzyme BshC [Alicyclobacillus sp. TC]|uniref:bacillithiol biosynthesis cysteine-adding enzyme BshC n=1 Tax=Alicyclobacillus sp. TC TaxID=2606450 RepID=UPI00193423D5|nr:bacillithiol biosynthesis cysteine-adding enzyme BshC [Alicyclobacillus sp. TC]